MTSNEQKALDAAERLIATCDHLAEIVGLGRDSYASEIRTQWAIEMGLIRLGEEVSRIPEEIRARFPGQPWRIIIDMRNMAAHQYDALTSQRVWRTLTEDIPKLRDYVAAEMVPALRADCAVDADGTASGSGGPIPLG